MSVFHGFLTVQSRGTLALPQMLRRKYFLDQPGAQVEVTEREDGVLELRPTVPVPASQAWFWTEEWQAGEREVDEHVRKGELVKFANAEEFLTYLQGIDSESNRK